MLLISSIQIPYSKEGDNPARFGGSGRYDLESVGSRTGVAFGNFLLFYEEIELAQSGFTIQYGTNNIITSVHSHVHVDSVFPRGIVIFSVVH
jgi:hypothetical protein